MARKLTTIKKDLTQTIVIAKKIDLEKNKLVDVDPIYMQGNISEKRVKSELAKQGLIFVSSEYVTRTYEMDIEQFILQAKEVVEDEVNS